MFYVDKWILTFILPSNHKTYVLLLSVADLLSAPLPPRTPEQVEAAFPGFDGAILLFF